MIDRNVGNFEDAVAAGTTVHFKSIIIGNSLLPEKISMRLKVIKGH